MPLAQNLNAFLGAAVLGVVGAAGLFLVEHYRHERQRQVMARDLARLDQEMRSLRTELVEIRSQSSKLITAKRKAKRSRHNVQEELEESSVDYGKTNSILSSTNDDYLSALNYDSSDQEFYDLSDDEVVVGLTSSLEDILSGIDKILDLGSISDIKETLQKLEELCNEYSNNSELLYRMGKAHYRIADRSDDKDVTRRHIYQGIEFCGKALELAPDHSEVHKWYAVLIGSRADFQSIHDKIADGYLFKKHIDIALSINPNDPSLHHMLGRFDYEVAALKWYERKIAAALFGEPPHATYEEALNRFMEAERLADFEWRENKLMLAKCKICLGQYQEAIEWLERAKNCPCPQGDSLEDKVVSEINALLRKYNTYR